jgi:hypothetical protein
MHGVGEFGVVVAQPRESDAITLTDTLGVGEGEVLPVRLVGELPTVLVGNGSAIHREDGDGDRFPLVGAPLFKDRRFRWLNERITRIGGGRLELHPVAYDFPVSGLRHRYDFAPTVTRSPVSTSVP